MDGITTPHEVYQEDGHPVFRASFQLPYSHHLLHIKIFVSGYIFFQLDRDDPDNWLYWDGSNHTRQIIKRDRMGGVSKWLEEYDDKLIEQFIALAYQASYRYFERFEI